MRHDRGEQRAYGLLEFSRRSLRSRCRSLALPLVDRPTGAFPRRLWSAELQRTARPGPGATYADPPPEGAVADIQTWLEVDDDIEEMHRLDFGDGFCPWVCHLRRPS